MGGDNLHQVHQVGAANVVPIAVREVLSINLEPHRCSDLHSGVLGQQLMGQAVQSAHYISTSVNNFGLRVCSKCGWVMAATSGRVLDNRAACGGPERNKRSDALSAASDHSYHGGEYIDAYVWDADGLPTDPTALAA